MISPAFFMASIVGFHVELSQAIYSGKRPYSTCMKFTSVTGPSVYWRSFWASASRVSVSWARASSESEEAARHMDKIIVLIIFSSDGEPTIPQVHYYHDNSTICARFCYSSGERFRSSCPVPFIIVVLPCGSSRAERLCDRPSFVFDTCELFWSDLVRTPALA